MDLWAFDDIDPLEEPPPKIVPKAPRTGNIPAPRDTENVAGEIVKAPNFSDPLAPRQESSGSDSISVNVSKRGVRDFRGAKPGASQPPSSSLSRHGSDFDELDKWEEAEPVVATPKVMGEMPVSKPSEPIQKEASVQPVAVDPIPSLEPEPGDDMSEFSPRTPKNPTPISIRPKLNLTKIESIGLASLAALILIGSGIFYFNTISRIPTGIQRAQVGDFPIEGNKISVLSAVTFWRVPITDGKDADTVRRDALLIPVAELALSGGPAAIRIFFRNNDGQLIGDAVNQYIRGDTKIQFAATDGFNDLGMHAAYRTGQTKPWTIEVFEAPSEESSAAAFKKLFEMNILSDRR